MQDDGKFNEPIRLVASKMRAGVATLERFREVGSTELKKQVCHSPVESHVRYMLPLYGGAFKTVFNPSIVLMKRAIRCVCAAPVRAHAGPLFRRMEVTSFTRLYSVCLLTGLHHEAMNLERPKHNYGTRFREEGHLSIPRYRLMSSKRTALAMFIRLFNALPQGLKKAVENITYRNRKISMKMIKLNFAECQDEFLEKIVN